MNNQGDIKVRRGWSTLEALSYLYSQTVNVQKTGIVLYLDFVIIRLTHTTKRASSKVIISVTVVNSAAGA